MVVVGSIVKTLAPTTTSIEEVVCVCVCLNLFNVFDGWWIWFRVGAEDTVRSLLPGFFECDIEGGDMWIWFSSEVSVIGE